MPADLHDDAIDPAVAEHLRHTLRRVALTTPLDGAPAPAVAARRPHRRALLAVATVATAGCVTAGLLVVSNRSSDEQQDQTPPAVAAPPTAGPGSGPLLQVDLPWQPMGIDATMQPAEPPADVSAMFDPTRFTDDSEWRPIGSPAYFDIPGLGVQAVYRAQFAANARLSAQERRCVTTAQATAATDPGAGLGWLCAAGPNDRGDVSGGEVRLLSLPPEVAFVTFAAGKQARWLRPVDGVAVLASTDGLGSHHLWTADGQPIEHESTPTVNLMPPPGQPLDVRSIDLASDEAQPILDSLSRSELDIGGHVFVVRPGSLRIFSIPDGGTFVVWESLFGSYVAPMQCVTAISDSGQVEEVTCGSGTGFLSSTSDGETGPQLFLWGGLGPEIAYTRFELDRKQRWASVIDGWAIIASRNGGIMADPSLVTVDGAGFGLETDGVHSSVLADPAEFFPNGTPPNGVELTWEPAFNSTLRECLLASGADPITGEYNGSEPADTLWARCVTQAVAAWRVAIVEVAATVESGGTPATTLAPEVAVTEIEVTEVAQSESPPTDAAATEASGSDARTPRPTDVAFTEVPSDTATAANVPG